jgi:hypothetical protein
LILSRNQIPHDLIRALSRLQETFGSVGVNTLAAKRGCSCKYLTVRFGREFGMPPKLSRALRVSIAPSKYCGETASQAGPNW